MSGSRGGRVNQGFEVAGIPLTFRETWWVCFFLIYPGLWGLIDIFWAGQFAIGVGTVFCPRAEHGKEFRSSPRISTMNCFGF